LIVWAGSSGKKILFIGSPRAAVITLGSIGIVVFCTISVGQFVSAAPAHPLTVAGYLVGTIAMLTFFTQVFKWKVPMINNPRTALFVLAGCIVIKSIIARIGYVILKIQS